MTNSTLASLLDALNHVGGDPQATFAIAVDAEGDSLVCATQHPPPTIEPTDSYTRVIEILPFVEYYLAPATAGYYTLAPERIQEAREMLQDPVGFDFGTIDVWWSGRRNRVWVTSFDQLKELAKGLVEPESATRIINALGLPILSGGAEDGSPVMLAIRYPSGHPIDPVQPTTFDAAWYPTGTIFLSAGYTDGWGCAHPCSGLGVKMKEAVHSRFEGLTSEFTHWYLGEGESPEIDRPKLVGAAYDLYQKLP